MNRSSSLTFAVIALIVMNVALLTALLLRAPAAPAPAPSLAATLPPADASATVPPPNLAPTPLAPDRTDADRTTSRAATPSADPNLPADEPLLPEEERLITLFNRLSPSVVFITTLGASPTPYGRAELAPQGAGSGFIWDKSGHIITNFHVIAQAREALVTLADGSEWKASLTGVAPDHDIAVLKIDAPADKLTPIAIGRSKALRVGQATLAIGNPFGLDQTLTTGIISALDRQIESISGRQIYGVIQTDAAINPGNSGGPLIDSRGRLIGMNTAIRSASGSSAGIGFAVPVDTISRLAPQLIKNGQTQRAGLGVLLAGPNIARRFGVKGAVIRQVGPGTPADEAGLVGLAQDALGRIQLGDVVIAVGDEAVKSDDDLVRLLDLRESGDEVRMTLDRQGARREVKVTLRAL